MEIFLIFGSFKFKSEYIIKFLLILPHIFLENLIWYNIKIVLLRTTIYLLLNRFHTQQFREAAKKGKIVLMKVPKPKPELNGNRIFLQFLFLPQF